MQYLSVYDEAFNAYGRVLSGYDTKPLIEAMRQIPLPAEGTSYEPGIPSLEATDIFPALKDRAYGGMPLQLGMCWGHNTKLNSLEYHRDSEINIGDEDFVLLIAKREEIVDGKLDTAKVKAFRVPAGVVVEVYATTLHFAPCHTNENGFRVADALPLVTNTDKPEITEGDWEDKLLFARNKWLIAHADAPQAKNGAYVGLVGKNIDIAVD